MGYNRLDFAYSAFIGFHLKNMGLDGFDLESMGYQGCHFAGMGLTMSKNGLRQVWSVLDASHFADMACIGNQRDGLHELGLVYMGYYGLDFA